MDETRKTATWGSNACIGIRLRSSVGGARNTSPPGVWMSLVVQLAPPTIGYVGVELGRGEVGVPEHLLHAPQVGASLE